jgi:hypothetical protein
LSSNIPVVDETTFKDQMFLNASSRSIQAQTKQALRGPLDL